MSNTTLVTGGAGFIGSQLVRKLIEKGENVVVIDNLSFGNKKFLPKNYEKANFYLTDIRNKDKLRNIMKFIKPKIVIHLAAIHFIPYCNEHPLETIEVNVIGTRNLLHCCELIKPDTVFFASSAAVYAPRNIINSEDSEIGPIDIYGITKLLGEELTELFHRRTGIRTIIGRFFNVYGPNETNPHLIPEIVQQLKNGKRVIELGNLEPKRDFIYSSDVVEAIIMLLEKLESDFGVFNIGSGKEYSVREVVKLFEDVLGEKILIKQRYDRIRKQERLHLLADITKINRMIGWSPRITFINGLKILFK